MGRRGVSRTRNLLSLSPLSLALLPLPHPNPNVINSGPASTSGLNSLSARRLSSKGRILHPPLRECGTHKTAKAKVWPWRSGKSDQKIIKQTFSGFLARKRRHLEHLGQGFDGEALEADRVLVVRVHEYLFVQCCHHLHGYLTHQKHPPP